MPEDEIVGGYLFTDDSDILSMDTSATFDPNKGLAPDILGGNDEEDEDTVLTQVPPAGTPPKPVTVEPVGPPATEPQIEDLEEEEAEVTEEEEEQEGINYFEVFGKNLMKLKLLDLEEGEDPETWTEENFVERFKSTATKAAWKELEDIATESHGQEGLKMLEDIFVKKVPIKDYLENYQDAQDINSLDPEKEDDAREIFHQFLSQTIDDEEEIEGQIAWNISQETLSKKATAYKAKLLINAQKQTELMAQRVEAQKLAVKQREDHLKGLYSETLTKAVKDGEMGGLPFTADDAKLVLQAVTERPHLLASGQRITEFELRLARMRNEEPDKFLKIAKILMDDGDLSAVQTKKVSKETEKIWGELQNKTKVGSKTTKKDPANSYFFNRK